MTLGLTEYETKTYLCLVKVGTLNAGRISKLAEIPHSKTYEMLTRLERRGLIEVKKGRPMSFKAVPHTIALENLEKTLRAWSKENFPKEDLHLRTSPRRREQRSH